MGKHGRKKVATVLKATKTAKIIMTLKVYFYKLRQFANTQLGK